MFPNPPSSLLFDESTSLPEAHDRLWNALAESANHPEKPLSAGQLSTCTPSGPRSRILILRAVDVALRQITAHTDLRSPKIAELKADPRVAWLFFDHQRRLQVRLWGTLKIHVGDETAHQLWEAARPETRRLYLAPHAPGTSAGEPAFNQPDGDEPTPETLEKGFRNFVALVTQVQGMDGLQIQRSGNLRVEFIWNEEIRESRWIQP